MFLALLGPFDLAIVVVVITFATAVLIRGQRSVHAKLGNMEVTVNEVASAVNNVTPDEGKLIDQVREIRSIGQANHLAIISCETTVLAFGQRLTAIGMKADAASKKAEEAQLLVAEYIHEQNIIDNAVRRGLLERRKE